MSKTRDKSKQIAEDLRKPRRRSGPAVPPEDLLSTGSLLLDLALSGTPRGGFCKGRYFSLVGASTSGKTFLSLTCLAEAARNPAFDGYRFVYDDSEGGALMDFETYFGAAVADRVEPPARDERGRPIYSQNIEDMYFHLDTLLSGSRPVIFVEDSLDALSSKYEGKKFEEAKKEFQGGAKAKGDYGDGKAKINSRYIRRVAAGLRDTGSILITISQERDNPDAGMFEDSRVYSGGRAIKFYAGAQIWCSTGPAIKKSVRGKDRKVGHYSKLTTKKNRLTGKDRTVTVPIHYSYGIDDLGSQIDYLVSEGRWKKSREGVIDATSDFDGAIRFKRDALIEYVERNNLEAELRLAVVETWNEIERALVPDRKKRY